MVLALVPEHLKGTRASLLIPLVCRVLKSPSRGEEVIILRTPVKPPELQSSSTDRTKHKQAAAPRPRSPSSARGREPSTGV